jgi:hypothetical protein
VTLDREMTLAEFNRFRLTVMLDPVQGVTFSSPDSSKRIAGGQGLKPERTTAGRW